MRRFWYFDVTVWSDEKKLCLLGLCQNGLLAPYCRTENPDTQKTYPSASDFHEYHSDTPRHPPDIPQTPPRHLQGAQHANRRQQTPIDTARHTQTAPVSVQKCLAVYVGICWRLLACFVPWRCLGGVCGISGGCLGVSEWYSWISEALGCVWGVSGFSVLQYGAKTPFWHNPKKHNFFSSNHTETSKYQNRRI